MARTQSGVGGWRAFAALVAILAWGAASAPALAQAAQAQAAPADVKVDADTFEGLSIRNIGPATMSGRIAALDAHLGEKLTVWAGAASGGVWKSTNGGVTFKPVFDKHAQSIGALAVDPTKPDTVWAGTGESWTRNSVSLGNGVYKTTDGGDSWQQMGLADSEHIARIVIHPRDSNVVMVCALGHLWSAGGERGVFRTKDGGKTWENVLLVDADTGCSDIALDPQDPAHVYAGMWQVRRQPWTFNSGGLGSGLYKSADGGLTWKKTHSGLHPGPYGRIAVSVSPARPSVVYAVVEAKKTALYRSDDLGETWKEMNTSQSVAGRPFYFAYVVADPLDFNRVYKPDFNLALSNDGGKTFSTLAGAYHGDTHALWINPKNNNHLILGTDGGVYISYDRGLQWRMVGTLPVSQFYHVSYDLDVPYNVYGGLQDNGTWMGPSRRQGGIGNRHWRVLGMGDGFWALVDPTNPDIVYVEFQGGRMLRVRRSTGETKSIMPWPREGEPKLRFNWNTPMHLSRTNAGTLYYGSQFLLRSRDRGESWERISGDLTTNDPEKQKQHESGGLTLDNSTAENHCTIFTISESPKNASVIWAGTDDGNVQITRDGGKTWTNVVKNIPGLPAHTWVSTLEASHYEEGAAYATFDGHATGDRKTYVYRTRDFGKTWQSLATADLRGYAHVVREDTVNPSLLYLGTESGFFLSLDAGANWAPFASSFPQVSVRDIAIHPREHDLILATHGRGVWILDDLTPLRKLTREALNSEVAFLPSRPAIQVIPSSEQRFDADDQFNAPSPEGSAWITYYLKRRHIFGDLRLEVYDQRGARMYTSTGGRRRGLNRFEWPMRLRGPKAPPATTLSGTSFFAFQGPLAPEGTYTVKMIKGKDAYTSTVTLGPDPRSEHSGADREASRAAAHKLYNMLERLTYTVEAMVDLRDQAGKAAAAAAPAADSAKPAAKSGGAQPAAADAALRKRIEALSDWLEKHRATLVSTRAGAVTGEERLREWLIDLYGSVNAYQGKPTESQLIRSAALEKQLEAAEEQFLSLASAELAALNPLLEKKKLAPLKVLSLDDWRAKQK